MICSKSTPFLLMSSCRLACILLQLLVKICLGISWFQRMIISLSSFRGWYFCLCMKFARGWSHALSGNNFTKDLDACDEIFFYVCLISGFFSENFKHSVSWSVPLSLHPVTNVISYSKYIWQLSEDFVSFSVEYITDCGSSKESFTYLYQLIWHANIIR